MLQVVSTLQGILIEERFLFAPVALEAGKIHLMPYIGSEMAYDIDDVLINVFVGAGDKLNFLVRRSDDDSFGVIQSPEVLESDEVSGMDYWIFADEAVNKKLDQLEIEGTRINLAHLTSLT